MEETRSVTGFERIRLQGSPDIKYTQGKTWSVRVKAPKSLISKVVTRKEGNCLVVRQSKVHQTQIELKGSGDVKVHCDNCGTVTCRLVGSGDITLSGTISKLNKTTRGSGDIHTESLKIK